MRRGAPAHAGYAANVIETDPKTWLLLATGRITWADARDRISASGERADLSSRLPIRPYGVI